jgi:nitroreductase
VNETIQHILKRRSVRSYQAQPVEQEKLQLILECGRYATSAINKQPWHFTVITDRTVLDKISSENKRIMLASDNPRSRERAAQPDFDSFHHSPTAIIVSGEDGNTFAPADCANAMENMAIAAQSLGLASCYLAGFWHCYTSSNGSALKAELGIPQGFTPLFALAFGYPAGEIPEPAPRREGTFTWITGVDSKL